MVHVNDLKKGDKVKVNGKWFTVERVVAKYIKLSETTEYVNRNQVTKAYRTN